MGLGPTGAASFSFKGSAIYIESLLNSLSPIYTVTLDGESTDVDGVRPSGAFVCAPLFSKAGLDPSVEHKVRMSVKGQSPNRNTSIPNSENSFVFSLISYTDSSTTPTSSGGSKLTTTDSANSATSSVPSGVQALYLPGWEALVAIMAIFGSL